MSGIPIQVTQVRREYVCERTYVLPHQRIHKYVCPCQGYEHGCCHAYNKFFLGYTYPGVVMTGIKFSNSAGPKPYTQYVRKARLYDTPHHLNEVIGCSFKISPNVLNLKNLIKSKDAHFFGLH